MDSRDAVRRRSVKKSSVSGRFSVHVLSQSNHSRRLSDSYPHLSHLRSSTKLEPSSPPMLARGFLSPQLERSNSLGPPSLTHLTDSTVGCTNQCKDVACPALAITPQCTDQCVVVACDDPAHIAPVAQEHDMCDGSDCSGLEEFLQCCTDFHAYLSDPRPFSPALASPPLASSANGANTWGCAYVDPSATQIRTANSAAGPSSNTPHRHTTFQGSSYPHSHSHSHSHPHQPFLPPLNTNANTSFPPTAFQHSPSSSQALQYPRSSVPTNGSLTCMWADCRLSFNTLSDLVGHVNLQHLRLPHAPAQAFATPQNMLSCHWADCTVFPSELASHLMQDHLGPLAPPLPGPPNLNPSPPPSLHSTPSPSPSPDTHDCATTTHPCRWRTCGQSFATCEALTAHLAAAHVGGGRAHYECWWDGCTRNGEAGFASKQKICRHLQSHTGHRPFQCQECKQNFSEAATLQQHMRRHTQEKPYTCDFPGCGKSFAITGALTIHKRTHNGDKPFKCTYCTKTFAESSNLSKHLRTHTGERPYLCVEAGCGKAFARPDQLSRHQNVHRGHGRRG